MIVQCKVKSIEPLASHTYQILLQPQDAVDFKAGQYLMVVMGLKDKRPFSIANAPSQANGLLELHIGAAEHNAYAGEVIDAMRSALANDSLIEVDAAHGDAWVKDSERPLLLIAGGTGFSYVRSILDECLAQAWQQEIHFYWGAKDKEQLYVMDELTDIAKQYANVTFVPVLEQADDNWQGKTGNVLQAVHQDFESLADYDIYLAGRFEMAGAARTQFVENKQALVERMFADAYAFI
ncbi:NAD(P)H-flavin reductase [Vibrio palustris]|uniref:NAD(P)H-flavin reductase n=1 Tax=Vibrio palustris TaxID=1918946 RepID=A0A1R4B3H6_9VIBR|nr:NAD(P)H-flavin reductase [Vibrio palustris]SJL83467.1 NAD(P)H-flavin reductase [Vibrio palustris]